MQDFLDSNNSCADLGRKRHSMDWYNPDASMDVLFPGICLKVAVLQVQQQQLDIDLDTHFGMFGLECSCLGCQSRRKQYYHRQEDKSLREQELMEVSSGEDDDQLVQALKRGVSSVNMDSSRKVR